MVGWGWLFVVVGFFMCGVLIMYLHVTVWRVFVRWCVRVVGRLGKQDMYYLNSKRDISIQKLNGDFLHAAR